jgi:outer membrane protein assembly factor BamB
MLALILLWLGPIQAVQSAPSMTPLWSYATGDALLSSPALGSNDTVYVGSYDQYLYAINSTNGQMRWRFSVEPTRNNEYAYIWSSPAIAVDGTIYFGTDHHLGGNGGSDGEFYALNPNGTLKWVYPLSDSVYSDPAIGADGTIYFGCFDTNFYALNPNGTLKWKFLAGEQIYSDPIVGPDGAIYFGADNGRLYALNTNGTLRWSFDTGRVITGSPAMGTGGVVYVGSLSSNLFAISPAGGTNWVFPTDDRIASSPAIGADGTIYVGCDNGRLYAVNPDGTLKWSALIASGVQSSPALAADGTIYVGTDDGDLHVLDANGNTLWSTFTGGYIYSSPVIAPNGTVFIGSSDTLLYAFAGTGGPDSGSWPMFRRDARHTARFVAPLVANTPPVISSVAGRSIHIGSSSVELAFTIGDGETTAGALSVSGESSNETLVPQSGLVFGGGSSNRTLTILPAPGQLGSATITLIVTDAGVVPLSATNSFVLNVLSAPAIQPAFEDGTNLVMSWNAIPGTSYRLKWKSMLDEPLWNDLPGDILATNAAAGVTLPNDGSPQRFFRVLVVQ